MSFQIWLGAAKNGTPSCAWVPACKLCSGNSIRKCEPLSLNLSNEIKLRSGYKTQNVVSVLVMVRMMFDNPDFGMRAVDCDEFPFVLRGAVKSDVQLGVFL